MKIIKSEDLGAYQDMYLESKLAREDARMKYLAALDYASEHFEDEDAYEAAVDARRAYDDARARLIGRMEYIIEQTLF